MFHQLVSCQPPAKGMITREIMNSDDDEMPKGPSVILDELAVEPGIAAFASNRP